MTHHAGPEPDVEPQRTDIGDFRRELEISDLRSVRVVIDSVSSDPDVARSALVQVLAEDERGLRIPLEGWQDVSPRVGEYFYLADGDPLSPATTDVRITAPAGASKLILVGHAWRSGPTTTLLGEPIVHLIGGPEPLPVLSPTGATLEWDGTDIRFEFSIPEGSSVVSGALYARSTSKGNSPVAVRVFDAHGEELLPPGDLPVNRQFGSFVNLAVTTDQSRSDFSFELPSRATTMTLEGVEWSARPATLVGAPEIWFEKDYSVESLRDFLGDNVHRPLVIIDTTAPPMGHETLALRPNNLALEYAELGYSVLFVPFGSTQEYPWIISDHIAQVPRSRYDEIVDHIIAMPQQASRTYICSSFPSLENNARAENLKRHGWLTVYEIRDDMEEFNRVGYSKWYHPLLEARMASNVDLVVTVSTALSRRIKAMVNGPLDVQVVPNGVKRSTLEGSASLRGAEAIPAHEAGGIVGYVGHLTPSWFDWNAVVHAAMELPDTTFEIVGHGKPVNLSLPPNVDFLGAKTHDELLEIVGRWKVALIPFIDSPLTRGVDPNKIYEYFAWGLRVVTARMGAVHEYPSTRVYTGADDLVAAVREMTATEVSQQEMATIADFALRCSWRHRAETMAELIEGARA